MDLPHVHTFVGWMGPNHVSVPLTIKKDYRHVFRTLLSPSELDRDHSTPSKKFGLFTLSRKVRPAGRPRVPVLSPHLSRLSNESRPHTSTLTGTSYPLGPGNSPSSSFVVRGGTGRPTLTVHPFQPPHPVLSLLSL